MISIVDDDESVREAINALVRSLGYAAATFASAEEFLSSDRVHTTSCLIADVQMPGLSGIDLQQRLLAQGLHGNQVMSVFFDGIARHTPEGYEFAREAARDGFREAVRRRDEPFGDHGLS